MRSRDIVRKAWQITQVHLKKLIWYGSIPAFFSIVVTSAYLTYQYFAFKSSELFNDGSGPTLKDEIDMLWNIVVAHPWGTVTAVVCVLLFLAAYMIFPPILNSALIHAVNRINKFEKIEGSFEKGVRSFFPMFEFGLLTGSFGITMLFTDGSLILRFWGVSVFFVILPVLLFLAMIGMILNLMFTYAPFYIVLKNTSIVMAIKESCILVISNLKKTILVLVLMLIISARVILNVLLMIFIPMMIILLSSYFAQIFASAIGITVIAVVSFAFLLASSYLLGLFHIFATCVWVMTFAFLTDRGKLESIHDEDLGGGHGGGHGDDHGGHGDAHGGGHDEHGGGHH